MKTIEILGVEMNPMDVGEFLGILEKRLVAGEKTIVANHNLHSVYLYHHDRDFRRFYQGAGLVHIDGMPLVFWAKLLGHKVRRSHRLTFIDFIWPFFAMAEKHKKSFFILGGTEEVGSKAEVILRKRFPGVRIGHHHGYFDTKGNENELLLQKIADFAPDVLLVGMGMPKQEKWILENLEGINATLIFNSGACFDYLTGKIPRPPRWLGRIGLEWLCRLLTTPQRVFRRYLWEPWFLLPLFFRDIFRGRKR